MKKFVVIIFCLFISICELNSIVYNTYNINVYEPSYATYDYIPFKSTSSNLQATQYNTVKPLNIDGTVSMDYTTYKGIYKPKRMNGNLDGVDDDDEYGIGATTPVGDPDIYVIVFLLVSYLICHYLKIRKSQMLLLNIQKQ